MKTYQLELTEEQLKKLIDITGEAYAALDDDLAGELHDKAFDLLTQQGQRPAGPV